MTRGVALAVVSPGTCDGDARPDILAVQLVQARRTPWRLRQHHPVASALSSTTSTGQRFATLIGEFGRVGATAAVAVPDIRSGRMTFAPNRIRFADFTFDRHQGYL
jgi:hypothetical protein